MTTTAPLPTVTPTRGEPPLRFSVAAFEGPLDLLLHLIRSNSIDVYDIPIAEITQQYLDQLALWEGLDLTVAGDYIVMAAALLEIKSRMLLPQPPPDSDEDADPRAELVQRLLEYGRYKNSIENLREWENYRETLFFRGACENPDDYLLPTEAGDLRGDDLLAALRRVLAAAGVEETPITAVMPLRRMNLRMKMAEVMREVTDAPGGLLFSALFAAPCPIAEIVMSFLAVLELLRQGRVRVVQRRPMSDFRLLLQEVAE